MKARHRLFNSIEMLSEVQLMMNTNTSLPSEACLGFDVRI